ncbi:hypothetical protein B0H12DRAFT_316046 [Mycena haematopus]|nr:hypothetical protein B0H12DRAFT_316046 [Mycena haematopus]
MSSNLRFHNPRPSQLRSPMYRTIFSSSASLQAGTMSPVPRKPMHPRRVTKISSRVIWHPCSKPCRTSQALASSSPIRSPPTREAPPLRPWYRRSTPPAPPTPRATSPPSQPTCRRSLIPRVRSLGRSSRTEKSRARISL